MTEKYTGTTNDKRYSGDAIDITYSTARCIHAAECTTRLSSVFDIQKRPWIQPDNDSADAISATIHQCPSGALHYDRKDGITEPTPAENVIILWKDGPLQFRGELDIQGATIDLQDTRATLCRCGASEHKPFCDNTHKETGFTAEDTAANIKDEAREQGGALRITVNESGPYGVEGNFEIHDQAGNVLFAGSKTWLCRCGGSSKKPFCDGTHNKNGFSAP